MNQSNDQHLAKTLVHGKPIGEIGRSDIEQRAREIAVINGHDPENPWPADRELARRELDGRALPETTAEDVQSAGSMSRDLSIPRSIHDRPKPNMLEPNEQEELEHLALEGVEEAQHDLMMEDRKRRET